MGIASMKTKRNEAQPIQQKRRKVVDEDELEEQEESFDQPHNQPATKERWRGTIQFVMHRDMFAAKFILKFSTHSYQDFSSRYLPIFLPPLIADTATVN